MAVTINPNSVNTAAVAPVNNRAESQSRAQSGAKNAYAAPSRADVNFVPSTESLETFARSGAEAARKGVYWDRGTILNLLA